MIELTIPFLGTLPGWITALASTATFTAVGSIWLKSRKLKIEEHQDDRAGYGDVINVLREEVARLASQVLVCETQHADCERRLTMVEGELRGVHRQMIANSISSAVAIGGLTPEMERAVDAVAAELSKSIEEEKP